jgi:hypothetical protein
MILKQLTVENYEKFRAQTQINFNTTGVTVLYGSAAASRALLSAVNWALYGEAERKPRTEGETLARAILGYDGRELIVTRREDGGGQRVHPVVFGLREDAVSGGDLRRIIADHHSPVWNGDVFAPMSFSSAHLSDVLREKLLAARLPEDGEETNARRLAEARTRMSRALEKQVNQTIAQFRFLCDDNDIAGWERFGPVSAGEDLSFTAENGDLTDSERYLYSMLFFLGEAQTVRKIFSKNYCDFIMLEDFLGGVDAEYWPAAAYFLSRWRQQAFVSCGKDGAERLRTLLPPETVWYGCVEDENGFSAEKTK